MKKALLVIDVQNTIVQFRDFSTELSLMENVINDFKENNDPVIFIRNISYNEESPFYIESEDSQLYAGLKDYADYVVEKQTPSAFFQTNLPTILNELEIDHLFIIGYNTEFCCMFTAIAAYDRGYKVTFIEDATGTVNDGSTYEMEDLDVRDFIGTVLHWSEAVEVLDFEEYEDEYRTKEKSSS